MAAAIQNPFAVLKRDVEEKSPVAASSSDDKKKSPATAKKSPKTKKENGTASPKTSKKKESKAEASPVVEKKAPAPAAAARSGSTIGSRSAPTDKATRPVTPLGQFLTLFKKFYLMFYNIAQAVGWTMILFFIVGHFARGEKYNTLWPHISHNVVIFQGLAFLEVFHAAFGLVPSSAVTTFIQIFSRVLLAVLVLPNVPQVQSHWLVATMVTSWAVIEMIRYPFYALSIFGRPPAWHVWLRYSAFWILYPTGGGSEAGLLYLAAPYVAKSQLFRLAMPNQWNFSFDFATFMTVFFYGYVIGLPYMMSHMVAQRRSALAKLKDQ